MLSGGEVIAAQMKTTLLPHRNLQTLTPTQALVCCHRMHTTHHTTHFTNVIHLIFKTVLWRVLFPFYRWQILDEGDEAHPESRRQPWFKTGFARLWNPWGFETCFSSFVVRLPRSFIQNVVESIEGNYPRRLPRRRWYL